MGHAALFLDRDGTIMVDAHYPSHPDQVLLLPGAAAAIARANAAGVPVVIVTNQSGIGRGHITEAQYAAVSARLIDLLEEGGARVDGIYHCPHWPERDGPCACRKPGIGMHQQAARDHTLSLTASVYIGDRFRDAEPAMVTGGLGVLVPGEDTPFADLQRARQELSSHIEMADNIGSAVDRGLAWIANIGSTP